MEDEPIYDFAGLKKLLAELGMPVGKAQAYRPIKNSDVVFEDKDHISFTSDGIFYIDPVTGTKQQIFLYKRRYRLTKHGKPRFHIRKCETINNFINSGTFKREYRKANTKEVNVVDMDDYNTDKVIRDLPLCQHCANIALMSKNTTTEQFVEVLQSANEANVAEQNAQDVDLFGYIRNWDSISQAVRNLSNYTCAQCGLKIDNPFEQHYMHTHHKDGNKLNNNSDNLECLCLYCHAHKPGHFIKLTTGANRVLYEDFCTKYNKPALETDPQYNENNYRFRDLEDDDLFDSNAE